MRRVLIVQAGSTDPAVMARFGDYPAWFTRWLAPRVEVRIVRPYEDRLPSLAPFHAVVMSGSPRSVTEPEPWMDEAASYLLDAARSRPVLGVCFGHQLLARALGGRVERNPRGREAGMSEVRLTEAGRRDALFSGIPATFAVHQQHEDHVPELPPGATWLAENDFSPIQAFGVRESIRCVQFHPEFDATRSRLLNEGRRARLDEQAPGGARAVLASIGETPHGERLLGNWLTHYVGVSP